MEISVKGIGTKTLKPNQVTLNFVFKIKNKSYNSALESGTFIIKDYIALLEKLNFKKDSLKTQSFNVSENQIYDEKTHKYIKDGFWNFTQNSSLQFNYDLDKLAKLMQETSKINNPPSYTINFTMKNDKKIREELLDLAFKDAEFQAEAIAKSNKKELKECVKVSFEPFDLNFHSSTEAQNIAICKMNASEDLSKTITNIFVPKDIEISTSIYCLWITK